MKEIISNTIFLSVFAGLLTAVIIAFASYIRRKYLKRKYDYLIGNWHGYYLIQDNTNLLEQRIIISPYLLNKLKIVIEESTVANYTYKGKIEVVDNHIFAYLTGVNHQAKSFLVLKLPFNRKDKVPSMNGIFAGLTQNNIPAATKMHWSRNEKNLKELKKELGVGKNSIIVDIETTDNLKRLDIQENLKTQTKKK